MATTAKPEVPDHVPPGLVRSAQIITGEEFLADPYAFASTMHERLPRLFWNAGSMVGDGWMTISQPLAFKALRDQDHFDVPPLFIFPRDEDNWFRMIPLEVTAPDHRKFRNILDPMLSPRGVLALEDDIRALANQLIDGFVDKGECEFTKEFARPLPVMVFLNFMGLPLDKLDQFVKWVVALIQFAEFDRAKEIMEEIEAYLTTVIDEKRANPDDKAVSRIVHAEFDGEPMTERDVMGFTFFLFIAGIDTVYAALNNSWLWMARHPERVKELVADPTNRDLQTEELLRAFAPTFSGRYLTQDLELDGVQLKKGDSFTSFLPACNYDPEVWDNPREIDFRRVKKPILTFTGGIHSCMGGHLARLEFRIGLNEWLRRIPEFRLKPGAEIHYTPGGVIGPDSVPLVW
jgi:cytochrome P450